MSEQRFHLISPSARSSAIHAVAHAAVGMVCEIRQSTRSLDQNAKLHAIFADIARQIEFFGQKRDAETVKRLLVDAFARVKKAEGEPLQGYGSVLPSLIGDGVVQLGIQTRRFTKAQMAEFITYLQAWCVDNDVRLSDAAYVPDWYQDREAQCV